MQSRSSSVSRRPTSSGPSSRSTTRTGRQEAVRLLHHAGVVHAAAGEAGRLLERLLLRESVARGPQGHTPIASVRSINGFKKYKLGAQVGTTSYDYIVKVIKPDSSPLVYNTNDAAVQALEERPDRRPRRRPADRLLRDRGSGAGRQGCGAVRCGWCEGALRARATEGKQADGVREQGAQPALAERDDEEPPAHLARQGDRRACPPVAHPEREPQLADPRRRDRPRLEGGADGRDRSCCRRPSS